VVAAVEKIFSRPYTLAQKLRNFPLAIATMRWFELEVKLQAANILKNCYAQTAHPAMLQNFLDDNFERLAELFNQASERSAVERFLYHPNAYRRDMIICGKLLLKLYGKEYLLLKTGSFNDNALYYITAAAWEAAQERRRPEVASNTDSDGGIGNALFGDLRAKIGVSTGVSLAVTVAVAFFAGFIPLWLAITAIAGSVGLTIGIGGVTQLETVTDWFVSLGITTIAALTFGAGPLLGADLIAPGKPLESLIQFWAMPAFAFFFLMSMPSLVMSIGNWLHSGYGKKAQDNEAEGQDGGRRRYFGFQIKTYKDAMRALDILSVISAYGKPGEEKTVRLIVPTYDPLVKQYLEAVSELIEVKDFEEMGRYVRYADGAAFIGESDPFNAGDEFSFNNNGPIQIFATEKENKFRSNVRGVKGEFLITIVKEFGLFGKQMVKIEPYDHREDPLNPERWTLERWNNLTRELLSLFGKTDVTTPDFTATAAQVVEPARHYLWKNEFYAEDVQNYVTHQLNRARTFNHLTTALIGFAALGAIAAACFISNMVLLAGAIGISAAAIIASGLASLEVLKASITGTIAALALKAGVASRYTARTGQEASGQSGDQDGGNSICLSLDLQDMVVGEPNWVGVQPRMVLLPALKQRLPDLVGTILGHVQWRKKVIEFMRRAEPGKDPAILVDHLINKRLKELIKLSAGGKTPVPVTLFVGNELASNPTLDDQWATVERQLINGLEGISAQDLRSGAIKLTIAFELAQDSAGVTDKVEAVRDIHQRIYKWLVDTYSPEAVKDMWGEDVSLYAVGVKAADAYKYMMMQTDDGKVYLSHGGLFASAGKTAQGYIEVTQEIARAAKDRRGEVLDSYVDLKSFDEETPIEEYVEQLYAAVAEGKLNIHLVNLIVADMAVRLPFWQRAIEAQERLLVRPEAATVDGGKNAKRIRELKQILEVLNRQRADLEAQLEGARESKKPAFQEELDHTRHLLKQMTEELEDRERMEREKPAPRTWADGKVVEGRKYRINSKHPEYYLHNFGSANPVVEIIGPSREAAQGWYGSEQNELNPAAALYKETVKQHGLEGDLPEEDMVFAGNIFAGQRRVYSLVHIDELQEISQEEADALDGGIDRTEKTRLEVTMKQERETQQAYVLRYRADLRRAYMYGALPTIVTLFGGMVLASIIPAVSAVLLVAAVVSTAVMIIFAVKAHGNLRKLSLASDRYMQAYEAYLDLLEQNKSRPSAAAAKDDSAVTGDQGDERSSDGGSTFKLLKIIDMRKFASLGLGYPLGIIENHSGQMEFLFSKGKQGELNLFERLRFGRNTRKYTRVVISEDGRVENKGEVLMSEAQAAAYREKEGRLGPFKAFPEGRVGAQEVYKDALRGTTWVLELISSYYDYQFHEDFTLHRLSMTDKAGQSKIIHEEGLRSEFHEIRILEGGDLLLILDEAIKRIDADTGETVWTAPNGKYTLDVIRFAGKGKVWGLYLNRYLAIYGKASGAGKRTTADALDGPAVNDLYAPWVAAEILDNDGGDSRNDAAQVSIADQIENMRETIERAPAEYRKVERRGGVDPYVNLLTFYLLPNIHHMLIELMKRLDKEKTDQDIASVEKLVEYLDAISELEFKDGERLFDYTRQNYRFMAGVLTYLGVTLGEDHPELFRKIDEINYPMLVMDIDKYKVEVERGVTERIPRIEERFDRYMALHAQYAQKDADAQSDDAQANDGGIENTDSAELEEAQRLYRATLQEMFRETIIDYREAGQFHQYTWEHQAEFAGELLKSPATFALGVELLENAYENALRLYEDDRTTAVLWTLMEEMIPYPQLRQRALEMIRNMKIYVGEDKDAQRDNGYADMFTATGKLTPEALEAVDKRVEALLSAGEDTQEEPGNVSGLVEEVKNRLAGIMRRGRRTVRESSQTAASQSLRKRYSLERLGSLLGKFLEELADKDPELSVRIINELIDITEKTSSLTEPRFLSLITSWHEINALKKYPVLLPHLRTLALATPDLKERLEDLAEVGEGYLQNGDRAGAFAIAQEISAQSVEEARELLAGLFVEPAYERQVLQWARSLEPEHARKVFIEIAGIVYAREERPRAEEFYREAWQFSLRSDDHLDAVVADFLPLMRERGVDFGKSRDELLRECAESAFARSLDHEKSLDWWMVNRTIFELALDGQYEEAEKIVRRIDQTYRVEKWTAWGHDPDHFRCDERDHGYQQMVEAAARRGDVETVHRILAKMQDFTQEASLTASKIFAGKGLYLDAVGASAFSSKAVDWENHAFQRGAMTQRGIFFSEGLPLLSSAMIMLDQDVDREQIKKMFMKAAEIGLDYREVGQAGEAIMKHPEIKDILLPFLKQALMKNKSIFEHDQYRMILNLLRQAYPGIFAAPEDLARAGRQMLPAGAADAQRTTAQTAQQAGADEQAGDPAGADGGKLKEMIRGQDLVRQLEGYMGEEFAQYVDYWHTLNPKTSWLEIMRTIQYSEDYMIGFYEQVGVQLRQEFGIEVVKSVSTPEWKMFMRNGGVLTAVFAADAAKHVNVRIEASGRDNDGGLLAQIQAVFDKAEESIRQAEVVDTEYMRNAGYGADTEQWVVNELIKLAQANPEALILVRRFVTGRTEGRKRVCVEKFLAAWTDKAAAAAPEQTQALVPASELEQDGGDKNKDGKSLTAIGVSLQHVEHSRGAMIAFAPLAQTFVEEDARSARIRAALLGLGRLGWSSAVDALVDALHNQRFAGYQDTIVQALGLTRSGEAQKALREFIARSGRDMAVKPSAVRSAILALGSYAGFDSAMFLRRLLDFPAYNQYRDAIALGLGMAKFPEAVNEPLKDLVKGIGQEEPEVIRAAILALGIKGSSGDMDLLFRLKQDPRYEQFMDTIILSIGLTGWNEAGDLLFSVLREDGGAQKDAAPVEEVGGVDFRAIPSVVMPAAGAVGAAGANAAAMTGAPVAVLNVRELDRQWAALQQKVRDGQMPYADIRAYVSACCANKEACENLKKASLWIAEVLKVEEDACVETSPQMKEVLALL